MMKKTIIIFGVVISFIAISLSAVAQPWNAGVGTDLHFPSGSKILMNGYIASDSSAGIGIGTAIPPEGLPAFETDYTLVSSNGLHMIDHHYLPISFEKKLYTTLFDQKLDTPHLSESSSASVSTALANADAQGNINYHGHVYIYPIKEDWFVNLASPSRIEAQLYFYGDLCANAEVNPPSTTIASASSNVNGHAQITFPFELVRQRNMTIKWFSNQLNAADYVTGSWSISGGNGVVAGGSFAHDEKPHSIVVKNLDPGLYHFQMSLYLSLPVDVGIFEPPGSESKSLEFMGRMEVYADFGEYVKLH